MGVGDGAAVGVAVTLGDGAAVGVTVTLGDGTTVGVAVTLGDGAAVGVTVTLGDGAAVGVTVTLGDGTAVGVAVTLDDGVGVSVSEGGGVSFISGDVGIGGSAVTDRNKANAVAVPTIITITIEAIAGPNLFSLLILTHLVGFFITYPLLP